MIRLRNAALGRHVKALLVAPPMTVAGGALIADAYFASLPDAPLSGLLYIAALLIFWGSLVGYVIELLIFAPVYWIVRGLMGAPEWMAIPVGALAAAFAPLVLHATDQTDLSLAGPDFNLRLALLLAGTGATGGAVYWRLARKASAPFSGFSESHP